MSYNSQQTTLRASKRPIIPSKPPHPDYSDRGGGNHFPHPPAYGY
eukprot:gene24138-30448_t